MLIVTGPIKKDYKDNNALTNGNKPSGVLPLVNYMIEKYGATNKPGGVDVGSVNTYLGKKTQSVTSGALKLHQQAGAGSCLITFHGEAHWQDKTGLPKSQSGVNVEFGYDKDRGNELFTTLDNNNATPSLLVYEKQLINKYATPGYGGSKVDEDDIIGVQAGITQRSSLVAGFIFSVLATGDQSTTDEILIYFGAEHNDILTGIEYFVGHSDASWMKKRGRSYAFIDSARSAKLNK